MDNYLKINKKPGWVPPLLLKADVNFSQISNLVLVVVALRGSEPSQPHKTLQYHPIFNLIFALNSLFQPILPLNS